MMGHSIFQTQLCALCDQLIQKRFTRDFFPYYPSTNVSKIIMLKSILNSCGFSYTHVALQVNSLKMNTSLLNSTTYNYFQFKLHNKDLTVVDR